MWTTRAKSNLNWLRRARDIKLERIFENSLVAIARIVKQHNFLARIYFESIDLGVGGSGATKVNNWCCPANYFFDSRLGVCIEIVEPCFSLVGVFS